LGLAQGQGKIWRSREKPPMNDAETAPTEASAVSAQDSDAIVASEFRAAVRSYLSATRLRPLLLLGDAPQRTFCAISG
jgi:hypothetical protein